jgi:hypothetical protein
MIEESPTTPQSDLKPSNLATTDGTHHIKPIAHANARSGHRQVPQTQSDAIPYKTLTYIKGNKRSPQQSTRDGGTNRLPEKRNATRMADAKCSETIYRMWVRAL